MSVMGNKALIIAVSLLVTMTITTGIIFTITQIKEIYADVYETDTTLLQGFDEYDKYDNTVRTGIEMVNAANKYIGNNIVTIQYKDIKINETNEANKLKEKITSVPNNEFASKEYNTTVKRKNDYITVIFSDK